MCFLLRKYQNSISQPMELVTIQFFNLVLFKRISGEERFLGVLPHNTKLFSVGIEYIFHGVLPRPPFTPFRNRITTPISPFSTPPTITKGFTGQGRVISVKRLQKKTQGKFSLNHEKLKTLCLILQKPTIRQANDGKKKFLILINFLHVPPKSGCMKGAWCMAKAKKIVYKNGDKMV